MNLRRKYRAMAAVQDQSPCYPYIRARKPVRRRLDLIVQTVSGISDDQTGIVGEQWAGLEEVAAVHRIRPQEVAVNRNPIDKDAVGGGLAPAGEQRVITVSRVLRRATCAGASVLDTFDVQISGVGIEIEGAVSQCAVEFETKNRRAQVSRSPACRVEVGL